MSRTRIYSPLRRAKDPVERLEVSVPISVKARALEWREKNNGNLSKLVAILLTEYFDATGFPKAFTLLDPSVCKGIEKALACERPDEQAGGGLFLAAPRQDADRRGSVVAV